MANTKENRFNENFLEWSIQNPDQWEKFMNCFDGTDTEDVPELFKVLRYLQENTIENIDNINFLVIELLIRTQIGGICLKKVMLDAFKDLWGEDAQHKFIETYYKKLNEILKQGE